MGTASSGEWIAILLYFALVIGVGVYFFIRDRHVEGEKEYFLGGRSMGGWVAALSAGASDMSAWVLMGLPGSIYLYGIGKVWIAVGLVIGTICAWVFVAPRLRRYSIRANDSITIPQFLTNRFQSKNKGLQIISAIVFVVVYCIYSASSISACGTLFNTVTGMSAKTAMIIATAIILVYVFLGGFNAVCWTDFFQGMIMLAALLLAPIFALALVGQGEGAVGGQLPEGFFHLFTTPQDVISGLGWGLGYFGMPHILVRFMAVRDEKEMTKSKATAISWVALSLGFAVFIGILGRAYLPELVNGNNEKVFIEMIKKVFTVEMRAPFIAGLFLCGILAAIMSTADSQLLVSASSVAEDIFKGLLKKDADDKTVMNVSRVTVLVVAVLAYIIAWNPNNTVMGLVSNAWAGLGAAFGPLVVMSLYWKRTNFPGAVAGIVTGALAVIIWDYIPLVGGQTLGKATGLYSLVVGFGLGLIAIIAVSLATKAPSEEMLQEFEDVKVNRL